MKKKILLLVLVIVALAALLAGCVSKPPHKILSDPWANNEEITYNVTRTLSDKTVIKGTSTTTTKRITDGSIKVGGDVINNFSGTFVSIYTALEDGSVMEAQVAFKSSFEPVASYKKINVKGYENNSPAKDTTQITAITYKDEKCYYETDFDGEKKSDSVKVGKWIKSPYYDNLMLYHVARSSYINNSFSSLTTKVLSTADYSIKTLTIASNALNQVYKVFGEDVDGIKADLLSIKLNQTFPGSGAAFTTLISREGNKNFNGIELKNERVPLIITEGQMEYKISAYSCS